MTMILLIAGKTESEIISMTNDSRCRWYKTILPNDKEEVMKIMNEIRRNKISKSHTGKILTKEHKNNLRSWWTLERRLKVKDIMTGRNLSEETKSKLSILQAGKVLSEGTRDKMRVSKTEYWKDPKRRAEMSITMSGENHWNWQNGKSFEPYGLEFNDELREQIRQRDNYACQECDKKQDELGYKLNVHHIDYDKTNNKPENLISLCRSCHIKTNYSREDWTEYFRKIVGEIKI